MAKTYTSVPTVSTGDVYTAAAHNVVAQNINNMRVPPICRVSRVASLSVNNAADTDITFDTEDIDTDGMFTASSTTITVQTAGIYLCTANVQWAANNTGIRLLYITRNAAANTYAGVQACSMVAPGTASFNGLQSCSVVVSCSVNDTIKMLVYQNSGGALSVSTEASFDYTNLSVAWLGQVS